jgi:CRP-like cAMP-binding protein
MSNESKSHGAETLGPEILKKNFIFRGLPEQAIAQVLSNAELIYLPVRARVYEAEQPIQDVYFPISSVLSIVTLMEDGQQIEIGTVGCEGVSAFPLLMGASSTANDCYCQVPGYTIKISATLFHELSIDFKFRQLLDRYLQAYVNMLGQLAACNRLHSIYERCSRWLLLTQDRVHTNEIELTHEYLAMMLGTGRSGVTIAAATLQQAGFITYARGKITIRNRQGLEGASCECYTANILQFNGILRQLDSSGE